MRKLKSLSLKFIFSLIFVFIVGVLILPNVNVLAEENNKVYLGGDTIGLKLDTGVYVAGKYEVATKTGKKSPWIRSDIEVGDKIVSFNQKRIESIEEFKKCLSVNEKKSAVVTVDRKGKVFETIIDILKTSDGASSVGLYLKDKMLGVGTLTFINPNNKTYASLGHGIIDSKLEYGKINGELLYSNVESIKKGVPGSPGEKRASLSNNNLGNIMSNSATGVYGLVTSNSFMTRHRLIEIAEPTDVKSGPAYILTVVENQEVKKFNIEIIEVVKQSSRNIKGMKIKVIDETLLGVTGGIIQGMSGSPIVQDDKLVGAVSHVSVDNPTIGYGMFARWMLDDANSIINNR